MFIPRGTIARLPFDGSLADVIGTSNATLLAGTAQYSTEAVDNQCFVASGVEYASMPFTPTAEWTVLFYSRPRVSEQSASSSFFILDDGVGRYGIGVYMPPGYGEDEYSLGNYGGWGSLALINSNDVPSYTDSQMLIMDPLFQAWALRLSGGVVDVFLNGVKLPVSITNLPVLTAPTAYLFGNADDGGLTTRTDELVISEVALTDEEILEWVNRRRPLKLTFYRRPVTVQFIKAERSDALLVDAKPVVKKVRSTEKQVSTLPEWLSSSQKYTISTEFTKTTRNLLMNPAIPSYVKKLTSVHHEHMIRREVVKRTRKSTANIQQLRVIVGEGGSHLNVALPKYKEALHVSTIAAGYSLVEGMGRFGYLNGAEFRFITDQEHSEAVQMIYETSAVISHLGQVQLAMEEAGRLTKIVQQRMVNETQQKTHGVTQTIADMTNRSNVGTVITSSQPLLNKKITSNGFTDRKYQLPKTKVIVPGTIDPQRPKIQTTVRTPVKKQPVIRHGVSHEGKYIKREQNVAVNAEEKAFIKKIAPQNPTVRANYAKYLDKKRKLSKYITSSTGNIQRIIINCTPWKGEE